MRISYLSISELGNGMLEMLLFMPLALGLLFVGTDIGILMLDRAMLRDVVREGGHFQVIDEAVQPFQISSEGRVLDRERVVTLTTRIGERMQMVINERRIRFATGDAPFLVEVRPVVLAVNPEMGTVDSFQLLDFKYSSPTAFNIEEYVPGLPLVSAEAYLESRFPGNSNDTQYGVLSPGFNPLLRYLPESLIFLITIEAVSPAISPGWQQMLLGSRTGAQVHQIKSFRN